MTIKMFTYPVKLTILFITYINIASYQDTQDTRVKITNLLICMISLVTSRYSAKNNKKFGSSNQTIHFALKVIPR